jgi:hypothetical protein
MAVSLGVFPRSTDPAGINLECHDFAEDQLIFR